MTENSTATFVTRREFNSASITALFVGMTVWVGGCGNAGGSSNPLPSPSPTPPATTPPATEAGAKSGTIAVNHGHAATVTSAQLQAGGSVTLNIQGSADHNHTVELSADQVRQIAGGSQVSRLSSEAGGEPDGYGGMSPGHAHSVTFN